MTTPLVIFLGIVLFGLVVVSYLLAKARHTKASLVDNKEIILYQDTVDFVVNSLYSETHGLVGRPDRIIERNGARIPIEFKTGRTPEYPFRGQIMQVIAYCALVEQQSGARPSYGIIRYTDSGTEFKINYTPQRERELVDVIAAIRAKRTAGQVHRSHTNARVCLSCGFRESCDERIDL